MISFRIWFAILRPFVAHPLFQRDGVWTPPSPLHNRWERLRLWFIKHETKFFVMIAVLFVTGTIFFGFWQTLFTVIFVPMALFLVLLPFILFLLGNVYGLMSAFAISDAIVHEKAEGRYTLLGLTPYGFEGATWALCSLVIHNNNGLRRVRGTGRTLYVVLISIVGISLLNLTPLAILSESAYLRGIARDLLFSLLVSILLSVEFILSSDVGAIIGMLVPTFSNTRFENRNRALSLFLAVQSGAYLSVALAYLFFVLPLFSVLGWTQSMTLLLGFGLTFIAIREVLIIVLWRTLARSMLVDLNDLDQLAHVGIRDRSVVVKATDVMVRFVFVRRRA